MPARQNDRRADLARIHILSKELGFTRDEYESVLFSIARVRSAGDLDHVGREQVIEHLAARSRKSQSNEWSFIDRASADRQPMLRKLLMLCRSKGYGKHYLDGMAKQMFAVDVVEFCRPDQLHSIVAALVKHVERKTG